MRYQGMTSILVTVNIGCTQVGLERLSDDENVSKAMAILSTNGSEYDVLIPNAVRSVEDIKAIAFECVTGLKYFQQAENFNVELKNLKYLTEKDFIMCMPIFEEEDFRRMEQANQVEEKTEEKPKRSKKS